MVNIKAAEGHVFVARGKGVAAKLIEASGSLGLDPYFSVQSVSGGYIVPKEIAEAISGGEETSTEEGEAQETSEGETPEGEKVDTAEGEAPKKRARAKSAE